MTTDLVAVFILLLLMPSSCMPMPPNWDIQAMYPLCRAWVPFTQDKCGNCCAMAIATALSARECIRDARNTLLSANQIWDCTGQDIADCNEGVYLSNMIAAMHIGSRSPYFLLPSECSNNSNSNPNITKCLYNFASCSSVVNSFIRTQLDAAIMYDMQLYNGPSDYGAMLATHNMMSEIMKNGPVISVISLSGADIAIFQNLTGNTIFIPQSLLPVTSTINHTSTTQTPKTTTTATKTNINNQIIQNHCIVVYGWGQVHEQHRPISFLPIDCF